EASDLHVANNADDQVRLAVERRISQTHAHRVSTSEHAVGNRLADDDNSTTIGFVTPIERPPSKQRHAERLKIVVTDRANVRFSFFTRSGNGIAVDIE